MQNLIPVRPLHAIFALFCLASAPVFALDASTPASAQTGAPAAIAAGNPAPLAPGHMRVHYHRAKNDTANWGVYSWQGPKNPSKTWIADRFMFEATDGFGGYTDIALDLAKSEMRFLVSSERGAKNCGNDQSVKLSADAATKGQEVWLMESDCAIHDKAPAL
jgi:hypothetical protein